ncbi:MAG: vWA domain-containing protein, partial [Bythopirellula sp.]
VSAAVLTAAQKTSATPASTHPAITYGNVKQLIELGIDETAIIARLSNSPTLFTLDATQEKELRALGASDKLFAALRGERPAPAAKSEEKVTDVAVILDCSGSMNEQTSDGKSKIDVAKSVVANMIQKYPEGLRVSLLVYGDTTGACDDVRLVRPLSTIDVGAKSWLNSEIHQLQAKGKTPIALSLRRAGQELAKFDSVSSIVLISDGKETCGGDPAAEAASLAQRFNLRYGVTVFGFAVDGAERASLEAIATAGNGKYFNAASAEELVQQAASAQQEIEVEPVKVTTKGRRAVVVKTPRIEFPAMKQIALIDTRRPLPEVHNYKAITESNIYDRPIRIPSGKKTYDLGFLPAEGMAVRLAPGIQIPDRSTIQIQPEDYLGLVNLGGAGLPPAKLIALVKPGRAGPGHNFDPVQKADRYGADLLVPAGKYDLWILGMDGNTEMIEEDLEVAAGQRLQLD